MNERDDYMARQEADHDLIRQRQLVTSCITDYEAWLRGLAAKGGKGVVNNIDARSLGRVADQLVHLHEQLETLHDQIVMLEHEVDVFMHAGIIEIAVRNPHVREYIDHWEGRALKAEGLL